MRRPPCPVRAPDNRQEQNFRLRTVDAPSRRAFVFTVAKLGGCRPRGVAVGLNEMLPCGSSSCRLAGHSAQPYRGNPVSRPVTTSRRPVATGRRLVASSRRLVMPVYTDRYFRPTLTETVHGQGLDVVGVSVKRHRRLAATSTLPARGGIYNCHDRHCRGYCATGARHASMPLVPEKSYLCCGQNTFTVIPWD